MKDLGIDFVRLVVVNRRSRSTQRCPSATVTGRSRVTRIVDDFQQRAAGRGRVFEDVELAIAKHARRAAFFYKWLTEKRLDVPDRTGGTYVELMELVQIDHTQSDLVVVDERWRKPIGRPWITLAIDIASRCVVGVYIAMERPSAATVALLLTRVALPKAPWLASC
ncbi:hypothetical protein C7T35_39050 [Variovorax sp. WS11]|uniref:hypothetical protein n=1 Tax=Variovorax sp. WS11 TaxID=1105204 RepID=UPI000D0DCE5E|nr:hypothetical protein [Variovorax sp. WS11]NDZ17630.1 hypothetical protein [Variovorax sp. WS11]PSL79149.1 hypothetical protein C7T35_39050 [Variovorax sp. WS11]